MEEQYQKLDDKYQKLDREYNEQQEAVQNVKKKTKQMLDELKRLAKTNEELFAEKEKAENTINQLKDEAKEWQIKYEKIRMELRSVKGMRHIDQPIIVVCKPLIQHASRIYDGLQTKHYQGKLSSANS